MQRYPWSGNSHAKIFMALIYPCKDIHGLNIAMQRHSWSGYSHVKTCMDMHNHAKTCMVWIYPCNEMKRLTSNTMGKYHGLPNTIGP